jgi:putative tryptophan/tyrosine transport system substrate-binding protein
MAGPVLKEAIGFLYSGTQKSLGSQYIAFNKGLAKIDPTYVDGDSIEIKPLWADDDYSKLPKQAKQLIEKENVAVLVAAGGPISALEAQKATKNTNTPVVFTSVANPVGYHLVRGLKRPSGNLTGIAGLTTEKDLDRLQLLHELKPDATLIGALINPNRPDVKQQTQDLENAAQKMGLKIYPGLAGAFADIETAIDDIAGHKVAALLVTADPFFNSERPEVVGQVADKGIPAIYQWREFVVDDGLMSYGPSLEDAYFQAGTYVGRILKGEDPADMELYQPTKFELVINRKTAKDLHLQIPLAWLHRPDIELFG